MKSRIDLMSESKPIGRAERARRRLTPESMTPQQRAAYERRRSARETPEAKAQLTRDIESIRQEFPPLAADEALLSLFAELRAERERQGLSLTDMMARTRIDRSTINKLENGKIPNPTYSTLKAYAKALGMRLALSLDRNRGNDDGPDGPAP
jgi:ribosome-binding protein aMBF1 (putative translation factor)